MIFVFCSKVDAATPAGKGHDEDKNDVDNCDIIDSNVKLRPFPCMWVLVYLKFSVLTCEND